MATAKKNPTTRLWLASNYHAFFSFCGKENRSFVKSKTLGLIQFFGFKIFLDQWSILSGSTLDESCRLGIERSRIFVPFIDEHYFDKDYPKREFEYWKQTKTPILPIFYCNSIEEAQHLYEEYMLHTGVNDGKKLVVEPDLSNYLRVQIGRYLQTHYTKYIVIKLNHSFRMGDPLEAPEIKIPDKVCWVQFGTLLHRAKYRKTEELLQGKQGDVILKTAQAVKARGIQFLKEAGNVSATIPLVIFVGQDLSDNDFLAAESLVKNHKSTIITVYLDKDPAQFNGTVFDEDNLGSYRSLIWHDESYSNEDVIDTMARQVVNLLTQDIANLLLVSPFSPGYAAKTAFVLI